MINIKHLTIYTVISVLLCMSQIKSDAQLVERWLVGGGLATNQIIGDHISKQRIVEIDKTKPQLFGGSFDMAQSGIDLRATAVLDKMYNHRVPIGIELDFYSAAERVLASKDTAQIYKHSINILTFYGGYQYVLLTLPWAKTKIYAGADIRVNYIYGQELELIERPFVGKETSTFGKEKDNAFRVGGYARIGFEGELLSPFQINASIGIGALNIIGRDDSRGELLTPKIKNLQAKETAVYNYNFSILVQYKI